MSSIPELGVDVDALFVANSAELQSGLVYVLGGAWTRCWPAEAQDYPYERIIPVVTVFRVPWGETNVSHKFRIRALDDDNNELAAPAEGVFKAGRQPDLTDGASQVVVATLAAKVRLARPGLYYIAVEVKEAEKRRIQFEAIDPPGRAGVRH
jgi:hypothetical protein